MITIIQSDRICIKVVGSLSHVLQQGGDAGGGLSSADAHVYVWHVHYCVTDLPQKELDRP